VHGNELFVASTLLRAGFDLELEDERDVTRKHPELVAFHRESGQHLSVEAKTRERPGVLGRPGEKQHARDMKLGIHRKLNDAAEKPSVHPSVVFVELNMPPERICPSNEQWLNDVRADIGRFISRFADGCPFSLIIATNLPHHYGEFAKPDPLRMAYICEPPAAERRLNNPQLLRDIELAIRQYGNVPNFFPSHESQIAKRTEVATAS
jgi:hypothetical protein